MNHEGAKKGRFVMAEVSNKNAGMRVACERCAKPCQVAPTRKTDAKMAIEADGPRGVCPECIVTGMIKGLTGADGRDDRRAAYFPKFTAESLRLDHIQKQIVAVVRASGSNLPADRLDFDEIIANWDLPLPKSASGGLFW
jgi:hypothetical protein